MRVQSYQVLQRNSAGEAQIDDNGVRVVLKTGGPYSVGANHHLLVGDLWVLAGQSNMEGCANLTDVESSHPFVHSYQSREEWAAAEEPLHWLGESPRIVHHRLWGANEVPTALPPRDPNRPKGAGLALTFAKVRYERTEVPIGLIPAAHGGTSMQQWDPTLRDLGSESLYGATIERIKANGGKIAGILWYQGESDCYAADVPLYSGRMTALVDAFRSDLGQPDLPFYIVQLGLFQADGSDGSSGLWSQIRELQRNWVKKTANTGIVAAIDLDLDDLIHVGTSGQKRLGRRFADLVGGTPTPDFVSAAFEDGFGQLRVRFANVRGGLQSPGRPSGFSIHSSDGREFPSIYKITLEGSSALLHLENGAAARSKQLYYGWGLFPYCNITDKEDAALPAFGPITL